MLKSIKKIYYLIKHSISGCHEKELRHITKSYAECTKCGRKIFIYQDYSNMM